MSWTTAGGFYIFYFYSIKKKTPAFYSQFFYSLKILKGWYYFWIWSTSIHIDISRYPNHHINAHIWPLARRVCKLINECSRPLICILFTTGMIFNRCNLIAINMVLFSSPLYTCKISKTCDLTTRWRHSCFGEGKISHVYINPYIYKALKIGHLYMSS